MALKERIESILFDLFINRGAKSTFIADVASSANINYIDQTPDDESILAYTDGSAVFLGSNLDTYQRNDLEFVLLHELYHIALLHPDRRKGREMEEWNKACDYIINNALIKDGYSTTIEVLINPGYVDFTEEELYEKLMKEKPKGNPNSPNGKGGQGNQGQGQGNNPGQNQNNQNGQGQGQGQGQSSTNPNGNPKNTLMPQDVPSQVDPRQQAKVNSVVQNAIKNAGSNLQGTIAGNLEQFIKTHEVKEKDWTTHLRDFMEHALGEWELDYMRANRRFDDFHIPSWTQDSENVKTLNFYIDTSGSVSDEAVQKYLSEIAYMKELFKPDALTINCFDTQIHKSVTFGEYDDIKGFTIVGRGGTDFECIREDIDKTKPICAVVFSDMYCSPMNPPKHKCGILWIQYADEFNNERHQIQVGKMVHFPTC